MKLGLYCMTLAAFGCAARQDAATTPAAPAQLATLEARVAELESRLAAQHGKAGTANDRADRADPSDTRRPRKRPPATDPVPALASDVHELRMKIGELERADEEVWDFLEKQAYGDLLARDPRFAWKPGQPRPQTKPDVVYSVPIANNAMRGEPAAKITWVIGMEVTEPFTRKLLDTMTTVMADYGTDLRVVFKHNVVHEFGLASALLLCAANQQGKFDDALANLLALPVTERRSFRMHRLMPRFATFLDRKQMEADLAGACKKIVRDDQVFAQRMGQSGTPYSFINGRHLGGAQPVEAFKKLVDEELGRANAALAGKSSKGFYETIVRRGQKQP